MTNVFQAQCPALRLPDYHIWWRRVLEAQEISELVRQNSTSTLSTWTARSSRLAHLENLNSHQATAIDTVVSSRCTMIKAPPATGKTKLAVVLARLALAMGWKFLYVAGSNRAVQVLQDRISAVIQESAERCTSTKTPNIFRVWSSTNESCLNDADMWDEPEPTSHDGRLAIIPDEEYAKLREVFQRGIKDPFPNSISQHAYSRWLESQASKDVFSEEFKGETENLISFQLIFTTLTTAPSLWGALGTLER